MITENLSTLKIHQLSEDQYKRLVDEGKDDENAFYLTPDVQIQSDWEEVDENGDSFIKNKPAIIAGQGTDSIVEGSSTNAAAGEYSHAEGEETYAFGIGAHAEGKYEFTPINWRLSTTDPERKVWKAGSLGTAAVGDFVKYNNSFFKIEAISNTDKTITFSASIPGTTATNVAFSYYGKIGAYGDYSHTEGNNTNAIGSNSHAEGDGSDAKGSHSHAEGQTTYASGYASHAEGQGTNAYGASSHAEGIGSLTLGSYSHAEGYITTASGQASHAEGQNTTASGQASHVQGTFNIPDTSITEENPKGTYAHIIGNGSSEENRSNAHTVDWSGNAYFSGDVYTGVTSGEYKGTETLSIFAKKLASEKYVRDNYLNLNGGTIESAANSSGVYSTTPLTIKGEEYKSLIKFLTRNNNGEGSIGIKYGLEARPIYTNSSGTIYNLGAYISGFETVAQNSPFNDMTWFYRKWIDGTIEVWGTYSMTITSDLWVEDTSQGINLGLVSLCPYRVNGHMILKLPTDIEIADGFTSRVEIATLQSNEEGWRPITIMQRRTSDVTKNTTLAYNFSTYFGNGTKDVPISVNFYIRW